jgi:hypothetical protein
MNNENKTRRRRFLAILPFALVVLFYAGFFVRNVLSPNVSFSPDKRWIVAVREPLTAWDPHVDVYYQPSWIPILLTKQMWFRGRTRSTTTPHHFSWQNDPFVVSVWKGGRPRAVLDRSTGRPSPLQTYWKLSAPLEEDVHGDMLDYLVEKRFSVQGFLFAALEAHDLETVQRLVEKHGADVNNAKTAPVTALPLSWAAMGGDADIVAYLLAKGAMPNTSNPKALPPICSAGSGGDVAVIELLLTAGADINTQGGQGKRSALHIAADHGHFAAAEALVKHGIDTALMESEGNTALDVAEAFARHHRSDQYGQAYRDVANFLRGHTDSKNRDNPTRASTPTNGPAACGSI